MGALLRDAKGMAELLNDLLLSAQLRTGSRPADLVDMEAVVRDAVSLDQVRAEQADVTLTAQVPPTPGGLHAWGSQPALRRAVGALVDNAIAHTPAGGTVAIETRASEGQVRVDVVDDGEGFDTAACRTWSGRSPGGTTTLVGSVWVWLWSATSWTPTAAA